MGKCELLRSHAREGDVVSVPGSVPQAVPTGPGEAARPTLPLKASAEALAGSLGLHTLHQQSFRRRQRLVGARTIEATP